MLSRYVHVTVLQVPDFRLTHNPTQTPRQHLTHNVTHSLIPAHHITFEGPPRTEFENDGSENVTVSTEASEAGTQGPTAQPLASNTTQEVWGIGTGSGCDSKSTHRAGGVREKDLLAAVNSSDRFVVLGSSSFVYRFFEDVSINGLCFCLPSAFGEHE